ncbi:hypothetical protein ACRE_030890 [Hapsidospora chrysogenum ATCC 11550]|uniref:Uncharacterized protein n=1 Tax=Hapsidospora chrysogenum (strain ATCC 11550 / CBS 779.69 / DSM 880 / IAM 14645 / JCM 23072 / IMI 49137) TaxID=857340 RepID=A0A086T9U8_HAPC1|nr:hypothetical protein ACRE_030890 [Hapsidospora chrysogenum ATCC 11550]
MAMFLHAGAGLHGHEYSSRTAHSTSHSHSQAQAQAQPSPASRPLPLLRSALRPRTFTDAADPRLAADPPTGLDTSLAARRTFSDPVSPLTPRRPVSDIVSRRDLAVRFQDPPMAGTPSVTTVPSDDEESVAGSDLSDHTDASSRRRRRKRSPRKTTRFALGHPAPRLLTKQRRLVQFRPRLLLQLQQVYDHRPIPAFDILPSSTVAGTVIIPRLAKRFPRIFRAKPNLCPDDLLVVRSEDYLCGLDGGDGREEGVDDRELVAVVSPLPDSGGSDAEIIMGDGSIWMTSHMPNGSYEFTRVDDGGIKTTARWVRKPYRPSKQASISTETSPSPSPSPTEKRWTFSIIDPTTRRHPIMGVLTPQELAVYDTYSTMSASSGIRPPTRPFSANLSSTGGATSPAPNQTRGERSTEVVPEEYRQLMTVTASWIALRHEGWPASSKPKLAATTSCRYSSSGSYAERRRTFPMAGTQTPLTSSSASRTSAEKSGLTSTLPAEVTMSERRKSTGATFLRSRRLGTDTLTQPPEDVNPVDGLEKDGPADSKEDEETHTCRLKMRRWTQKLFHRKSYKTG